MAIQNGIKLYLNANLPPKPQGHSSPQSSAEYSSAVVSTKRSSLAPINPLNDLGHLNNI